MKTVEIKCARCGKQLSVTLKTATEEIECTHCHKKAVLTSKSKVLLLAARYICVAITCFILMFALLPLQNTSQILYFAGVFLAGVVVASLLEPYCIKIAFILFRLSYIDVDEAQRLEKEKEQKKLAKKFKNKK